MAYNINKARGRWAQVSRVLTREGASPKVSGFFYKAIVQSVLLFGSETWVHSKPIVRSLEGFHQQIARRLTRRYIWLNPNTGEWLYPAAGRSLELAGLFSMSVYLDRRMKYIKRWVRERPLYNNCKNLTGGAGGPQRLYWWTNHPIPVEPYFG